MSDDNKSYGRLEVDIPDDSFEAGKINTARIIIKNPFEVPIEIINIESPRSSTLKDINRMPNIIDDQLSYNKAENNKHREQKYEVKAGFGKGHGIFPSILNMLGLSAEVKFGEVRSSRERTINITAMKDSEITIDQELGHFDTLNITSEEGSKLNIKENKITEKTKQNNSDTITVISPHCEVVHYFPFKTSGWLLFKPTRININIQVDYRVGGAIRTQVVPASMDVKPPIASMVLGALSGSILGTLAKIFAAQQSLNWKDMIVAIGSSTVMSLIATIALMRKTGSQGFITVEDFFGAFVLGTLIGYSGSDYFEKAILPDKPK